MKMRRATSEDRSQLRYLGSRAFGVSDETTIDAWLDRTGFDAWRVLADGPRLAASALLIPQGHYYGGREVSMLGLAGVATAPEARGRRVGLELMKAVLQQARAEGTALSTLYPSTREFYRRLGYELAGDHATITCELHRLPPGRPADEIVRIETDAHRAEARALYERVSRPRDGALARGPYVWGRVFASLRFQMDAYLLRNGGEAAAYAAISLPPGETEFYDVKMYDWAFADARGLQAVFHFLRGYRSLGTRLVYTGAVADPFVSELPARSYEAKMEEPYMMRLLDASRAFSERGYPDHVQASLTVAIEADEVCPDNVGVYRLEVRGGRADVLRLPAGTHADVSGSIRGISALYSPYMPASELARMGWIQGSQDGLRRAEQIFGRCRPHLRHMF